MVKLGHNLGNSQVSVYRTIGPTLVSYFCSKHRLWVRGRAALLSIFRAKIRKMYTPPNPSFTIHKSGNVFLFLQEYKLDRNLPISYAQDIFFSQAVMARYVKIILLEAIDDIKFKCLKLELIGCLRSGKN